MAESGPRTAKQIIKRTAVGLLITLSVTSGHGGSASPEDSQHEQISDSSGWPDIFKGLGLLASGASIAFMNRKLFTTDAYTIAPEDTLDGQDEYSEATKAYLEEYVLEQRFKNHQPTED